MWLRGGALLEEVTSMSLKSTVCSQAVSQNLSTFCLPWGEQPLPGHASAAMMTWLSTGSQSGSQRTMGLSLWDYEPRNLTCFKLLFSDTLLYYLAVCLDRMSSLMHGAQDRPGTAISGCLPNAEFIAVGTVKKKHCLYRHWTEQPFIHRKRNRRIDFSSELWCPMANECI